MRYAAVAVVAILCLTLLSVVLPKQTAMAYDSTYLEEGDLWDEDTFTDLNVGIYWYSTDTKIPKKQGNPNANFDPNKPTFIFTHGMKPGEGYRARDLISLCGSTDGYFADEGFVSYEEEVPDYDPQFYLTLLNLGYNVGQFYWSQLAEEDITGDVKIWCSGTTYKERYKVSYLNGTQSDYIIYQMPTTSVSVLYGEAIKEALGPDYNQTLRIAGHSMGGQLSLATCQYLVHQYNTQAITNKNLVPERVSLIDPYLSMTKFDDAFFGSATTLTQDSTGYNIPKNSYVVELVAQAMDDITEFGVAVDAYSGNETIYRLYNKATSVSGDQTMEWANAITDRITRNATWTFMTQTSRVYTAELMAHTLMIDYFFTTMYEEPAYDNWGLQLPSLTMSTADVLKYRGIHFEQSVKSEDVNPFFQHNNNYIRCDAYHNPITVPIGGTANKRAVTADLYKKDSDVLVASAEVQNGEYNFAVTEAGDYTVKMLDGKGKTVETKTFAVTNDLTSTEIKESKLYQIFLAVILSVIAAALIVVGTIYAIKHRKKKNKPSRPDYARTE